MNEAQQSKKNQPMQSDVQGTQSDSGRETSGGRPSRQKQIIWAVISVLVIAAIAAAVIVFVPGQTSGEPVAVVNGEEISEAQYEAMLIQTEANLEQQGADLSNEELQGQIQDQVLTTLVNETLVLQQAKQEGISPSDEEIDAQLSQVESQFAGTQAYQQALAQQGLTQDSLREQIERQLTIQNYLSSQIDTQSVTVSEEEVQNYYDQVAATGQEVPSLAEVREQIVSQLRQQKEQQLVAAHIQELRENAEIEILI